MPKFVMSNGTVSDSYILKMDNPSIRVVGIERDEVLHILASDDDPSDGDIAISFYHESKPRSNTAVLPFGKGTRIRFKLDNSGSDSWVEAWVTEPTINNGLDVQLQSLEVLEEIKQKTCEMLVIFKEWAE